MLSNTISVFQGKHCVKEWLCICIMEEVEGLLVCKFMYAAFKGVFLEVALKYTCLVYKSKIAGMFSTNEVT